MKLAIFSVLCFVAACSGWTGDLRVRFGISFGSDYFVHLPKTVSDAVDEGWTSAPRANSVLPTLTMYCHASYIICVMYEDTEYVAGLQVAFPEDRVSNVVYNWTKQGFTKWSPDGTTQFWATHQYYVDEDYLAIDADERVSNRDGSNLLQADGRVWVSGFNGEILEISNNATGMLAGGFTEQACIPFMGKHYYYEMTEDLSCDDGLFPWFPLTDRSGRLIVLGMMMAGNFNVPENGAWFESPTASDVEKIVPTGPQCLYKIASNPGVVTIHTYFVSNPLFIFC